MVEPSELTAVFRFAAVTAATRAAVPRQETTVAFRFSSVRRVELFADPRLLRGRACVPVFDGRMNADRLVAADAGRNRNDARAERRGRVRSVRLAILSQLTQSIRDVVSVRTFAKSSFVHCSLPSDGFGCGSAQYGQSTETASATSCARRIGPVVFVAFFAVTTGAPR
jgi:hypothetical protein